MTGVAELPNEDLFVLAVDLDGVCADYYGGLRPIVAEWLGVSVDSLPVDVGYGFTEWGIDQPEYERLHYFAVTERGFFENLPVIPGAGAALRRMSKAGVTIRIVTARLAVPRVHAETIMQTVRWIEHVGIPFDDICFVTRKDSVAADIYVEDSPHHVAALRARGIETLVFANSTNRELAPDRVGSWEELEKIVMARKQARRERSRGGTSK